VRGISSGVGSLSTRRDRWLGSFKSRITGIQCLVCSCPAMVRSILRLSTELGFGAPRTPLVFLSAGDRRCDWLYHRSDRRAQTHRTDRRAPLSAGGSRRYVLFSDRSEARGARRFCGPRPRRCARRFCTRFRARKCAAQRRSDQPDPSFRTALWLDGARQRRVFSVPLCSICGGAIAAQRLCISTERDRSAEVRTGARHRLCR
jgi:hypothetical protein